jgi:hypothetical protein
MTTRSARLRLEALESREVPAWFAVSLVSPSEGIHGDSAANGWDAFVVNKKLAIHKNN